MVQKLSWMPGTKESYDSFGFGMLKLIVTRVSGQSYTDYLRHHLCQAANTKNIENRLVFPKTSEDGVPCFPYSG